MWYRTARATCSVGGVGSTNGANGASGFSTARPTSIRCRAFVDGIGPFPFRRRTSQCDGTQIVGSRPGDEAHVAAEVVRRAQVDEPSLDRRLAEEHRRGRLLRRSTARIFGDTVASSCENRSTAPLQTTCTSRSPGRELRRRERQRAVLHHEPAREHGGEHGRARDDADRDEDEPLAAGAEARPHEPEREGDPNELRHQYSDSTGV